MREGPPAWGLEQEKEMIHGLAEYGFSNIKKESFTDGAYKIVYTKIKKLKTVLHIELDDWDTGADVLIGSVTTPLFKGLSNGTAAVRMLISWARAYGLGAVWAGGVKETAESFLESLGFECAEEPNPGNDYRYKY